MFLQNNLWKIKLGEFKSDQKYLPNKSGNPASLMNNHSRWKALQLMCTYRGGSRAVATSKMERFVIIVNGFQPLTIVTKHSILDVAGALDPRMLIVGEDLLRAFYKMFCLQICVPSDQWKEALQ